MRSHENQQGSGIEGGEANAGNMMKNGNEGRQMSPISKVTLFVGESASSKDV
jgi:hypothetical protein